MQFCFVVATVMTTGGSYLSFCGLFVHVIYMLQMALSKTPRWQKLIYHT